MLGPLAKALSLLSSDAGQILVQIEEATRTAGVDFERQIKAANESLETTITATGQATVELNRAAGNLSWVRYGLTMMSGLGAAALRVLGLAQHAERAADRGLSSGGRGARADADRGDQDRQRTGQAGKVQAAAASFALAAELACLECEREERVRRLLVQAEQRQARREQALRRLVQARPEVPQGPCGHPAAPRNEQALVAWEIANGVSKATSSKMSCVPVRKRACCSPTVRGNGATPFFWATQRLCGANGFTYPGKRSTLVFSALAVKPKGYEHVYWSHFAHRGRANFGGRFANLGPQP